MKRALALICFLALPAAAQEYKIAVVSMLHAHVWLHLGTMLKGDKVKLVGVSETLPDLIARATREDVIPQTQNVTRPGVPESMIFSDWKKMIDETKPDVVWAFTPTNEHVDVVRYCAPRGIHVIVEKPLAATLKEALEIQALARKHNIMVMTNYGSTWSPMQYAVRAAIDSGAIGPVWRLHAMQGHNGPGDPKRSSFAAWLADPVQNGGGASWISAAISHFGAWDQGHASERLRQRATHEAGNVSEGRGQRGHGFQLQGRGRDPRASWAFPPAQRLGNEIYGMKGSIVGNSMRRMGEQRGGGGRGAQQAGEPIDVTPLPPERAEPIAYMVDRIRTKQPLDGPSALDINVQVQEILEAAKMSVNRASPSRCRSEK
jgi:predicted dehydrogenase